MDKPSLQPRIPRQPEAIGIGREAGGKEGGRFFLAMVAALTIGGAFVFAGPNEQAAPKFNSQGANQIRMRTMETSPGVHTPIVMMDPTLPTPVATPSMTVATSSGAVAAGSRGVTFILSGDFSGTILGVSWSGSVDNTARIPAPSGFVLASIPYTVTAGNLRILDVR